MLTLEEAFEISNAYAPEHLILALRDARDWLPRVRCAGSVFLGDWAPEALGDYCSGTNHVLPTSGAARWCSGLSVASFQTSDHRAGSDARAAWQRSAPARSNWPRAEGLDAHRLAVQLRLEAVAA